MKMLGKAILAMSLCGLAVNAVEVDIDKYKCKTEENVFACTKVGLRDMEAKFDKTKKELGFERQVSLEDRQKILNGNNFQKIMDVRLDAYKDLSDYCLDDHDYLFFSEKKANQLSGKSCSLIRNDMAETIDDINKIRKNSSLKQILRKDEDFREVLDESEKKVSKMYAKLASRGCELGDYESCKEAFLIYHPAYNFARWVNNADIIKDMKQHIKTDAKTSIKFYQKACKIKKKNSKFCDLHEEYIDIED